MIRRGRLPIQFRQERKVIATPSAWSEITVDGRYRIGNLLKICRKIGIARGWRAAEVVRHWIRGVGTREGCPRRKAKNAVGVSVDGREYRIDDRNRLQLPLLLVVEIKPCLIPNDGSA